MSKPVVFVIGASGQVGTATLSSLSAKYADKVEIKAGVRNLEKAGKLKALPNVTVVQTTMGDSSLVDVLSGVSTLYIASPSVREQTQLITSTAEYAKQAGVKHIAFVGVLTGDYLDHIFGGHFGTAERNVAKLGVPYTFLRFPTFMTNYLVFLRDSIVKQGTILWPTDPNVQYTSIAVEDIGNVSAAVVVNPEKYANRTITTVGDRHTYNDLAKALSDVLGKEVKYVRVSYETATKSLVGLGLEQWQAKGILEVSQKLMDTSSPTTTVAGLGVYNNITGEQPQPMKQWVAENAGAFQ